MLTFCALSPPLSSLSSQFGQVAMHEPSSKNGCGSWTFEYVSQKPNPSLYPYLGVKAEGMLRDCQGESSNFRIPLIPTFSFQSKLYSQVQCHQ